MSLNDTKLTPSEEAQLFRLLDDYSRLQYKCFVSELFLNKHKPEYTVCFRSTASREDSTNRYACRYLHIDEAEAKTVSRTGALTASIIIKLENELPELR
jgi:hypothetical protein